MTKKIIVSALMLLAFVFSQSAIAQIIKPVQWEYSVQILNPNEAELIFKAKIQKKWHLYGQFFEEGGPVRMSYRFNENDKFETIGKVAELPKPKIIRDEIFDIDVQYFEDNATFKQKIKIKTNQTFTITGDIEYQVCYDDKCIMENPDFEFTITPPSETTTPKNTTEETNTKETTTEVVPNKENTDIKEDTTTNTITFEEVKIGGNTNTTEKIVEKNETIVKTADKKQEEKSSLWTFFWIAFLAGIITLITPCVFPVIPMTVSFFMHSSDNKVKAKLQAVFYGASIVLIYTLPILILTILTAFLGSNVIEADFANTLSTHWFFNILFTLIFLVFAASFFGLFEITLPSWMVNKADSQADKGGYLGAFFMAFTLVLVSFSCTGPIVGTIIVQSLTGLQVDGGVDYSFGELLLNFGEPTIGMLGYSLGIAVPFTLFALFPSMLQKLPKSGGWLNAVKVVLGFIELALALKFLSVSDQAYHWGILDREVYLAFWIVIFSLLGFYFLGKIRFSHDSKIEHVGVGRLMLAIITFTFVVYMIPGMFGAPLKALSGYLPPQSGHDFDLQQIIRENNTTNNTATLCGKPKYADKLHLPHGLKGYYDLEQALKCAKELNKPVFIDFTGHGCVNCRKMEEFVWVDDRVLKILKEDYIVVALYVDDKTELPESEWITSEYDGKVKKTIGKKYADYQISKFNINAQPYYVLMGTDGEPLEVEPKAYDLNIDSFIEFLEAGKKDFQKKFPNQ